MSRIVREELSPEQKAFKKFMDDATPANLASYLSYWVGGLVSRVVLLTPDGGEMNLDMSKSDQMKAFKKAPPASGSKGEGE